MIWHSSSSNAMLLDTKELEQLTAVADSTVVAAEERQQREAEGWLPPSAQIASDKTYAQGVRDALGWLAGQHSPDRLAALLDIDPDQR